MVIVVPDFMALYWVLRAFTPTDLATILSEAIALLP
jgi:hypothetical protein